MQPISITTPSLFLTGQFQGEHEESSCCLIEKMRCLMQMLWDLIVRIGNYFCPCRYKQEDEAPKKTRNIKPDAPLKVPTSSKRQIEQIYKDRLREPLIRREPIPEMKIDWQRYLPAPIQQHVRIHSESNLEDTTLTLTAMIPGVHAQGSDIVIQKGAVWKMIQFNEKQNADVQFQLAGKVVQFFKKSNGTHLIVPEKCSRLFSHASFANVLHFIDIVENDYRFELIK